jgi:hypothetical protein
LLLLLLLVLLGGWCQCQQLLASGLAVLCNGSKRL